MRLRTLTLPLLLAAVSCQSTSNHDANASTPGPAGPSAPSKGALPANATNATTPGPAGPSTAVGSSAQPSLASFQDGGIPQDALDRARVRRQRGQELSRDLVTMGTGQIESADLRGALVTFSQAAELDPQNQDATAGLLRIQALLGDEFSLEMESAGAGLQKETIRRQVARAQAQQYEVGGDHAYREGRYDEAVHSYRQGLNIVRWHPMIEQGSLTEELLAGKLEQAITTRDEAVATAQRQAREDAAEQVRRIAEAERERRENKLENWFRSAQSAFMRDDFEDAEHYCRLILAEDAQNATAQELKAVAAELRHQATDERIRKQYREQWQLTFDELSMMDVPQSQSLVFDHARWREVAIHQPLSSAYTSAGGDAEHNAILARLDEVLLQPQFDETELDQVRAYLQQLTGVNFFVSPTAAEDLDPEELTVNLNIPQQRSVRKVLDLITETKDSLRWRIADGMVKFVTIEELVGGQVLINYSVHDLITPIPDYPGRDINVAPSGGIVPPDDELPERDANVIETGLLEDLIRNNISPESWDADVANSIRITETGTMVVNQTPEVQKQIAELLEDLREATGIMVDIQARFMTVEDSFLEDIGVDSTGLGQPGLGSNGNDFNDFGDQSISATLPGSPGLDNSVGAFFDDGGDGSYRSRMEQLYDTQLGNDDFRASGGVSFQWTFLNDMELELILRAVSKSERIELVTAPRILVHNAARANLSVLNQVAYVQDFDVEIAQSASIADPIVAVIQDGVILDVRPVVSADRRFITLELRPTIANLVRPIEQRVTTLGSSNSVTIELPEVEIQRVRTSVPLPDGGTVMLGGNKISQNQSMRSGVPILNKIPILSALFERKGNFISKKKLLILVKANIVIPKELEPTPAELGQSE